MGIKVELDYEVTYEILVESLKEQYGNVNMMLENRYVDKSKDNYGMFHNNKKKDIVAIKELLKSFEDVLRYNMVDEDFQEWKCVQEEME